MLSIDLLTELNLASLSEIDEPTLDVVLKYHVVGGANVLDSNLTDNSNSKHPKWRYYCRHYRGSKIN